MKKNFIALLAKIFVVSLRIQRIIFSFHKTNSKKRIANRIFFFEIAVYIAKLKRKTIFL